VAAEVVRAALARALQALWRGHLARLAAPPLNENLGGDEAAAEDFDSEELRFLRGLRRNRNGDDAGRRPPLSHLELLEAKHTLAPFSAEEAYAAICALGAKPGAGGFAGAFRVFARARAGDLSGGEALPQLGGGGGGKAARVVAHGLAARVADLEAEAAAAWGPLAEWARRGLRAVQAERERRAAVFRAALAAEAAEEEGTA
jgi:hypothetical protein